MTKAAPYRTFPFHGRTGYILGGAGSGEVPAAIGHTASVPPWQDPGVHLHQASTEIYLLLEGKLDLLLDTEQVSLRPWEMLLVHPLVPHAVLGGDGPIEHLGIRTPARDDKQLVEQQIVASSSPDLEAERELNRPWGYRIPLQAPANQNCWLLGGGTARFPSPHLSLAWINFPTHEAANSRADHPHDHHYHRRAHEYYCVLSGALTLRIQQELVTIEAGTITEIPPQVCHSLHGRQAPYLGFTLRVPLALDDKVTC